MARHEALLNQGTTPTQETRGWNPAKSETFSQRTKEDAEDYRYFPDPDLPPIRFTKEQVAALEATIPELPAAKQARWQSVFGIEPHYAELLTTERDYAEWLETIFEKAENPNTVAKALVNKKITVTQKDSPKEVLAKVAELSKTDSVDTAELSAAVQTVLANNQDAVEKFRAGDQKVLGFFIGQVLRTLGKKADATLLRETVLQELTK